jgi:hypothetical protein
MTMELCQNKIKVVEPTVDEFKWRNYKDVSNWIASHKKIKKKRIERYLYQRMDEIVKHAGIKVINFSSIMKNYFKTQKE